MDHSPLKTLATGLIGTSTSLGAAAYSMLPHLEAWMRLLPILAALLLAACALPPAPEPEFAGVYRNACLPEAIAMSQSLRKHGIEARVLGIYTDRWGHAVCTYLYPPGANKLWAWDSTWKSLRVRAWTDDPASIARNWLASTHPGTPLARAEFLQ